MLEPGGHIAGVNVSRETLEMLRAYEQLLLKWTPKINLIARSTTFIIWDRHITDSAQVFTKAVSNPSTWLDLGSGGGLPAIVCAILAKQHGWRTTFILVESDQRKAAFLRTTSRELNLNATVHCNRIETTVTTADVVSARALAPLGRLLSMSEPFVHPNSQLLFPKGAKAEEEISEARRTWHFKLEQYPSITDERASILSIGDLVRA